MSDTERVVEIIRVMGMNNIQFSQKTGISPASLSHITSGRSNPTLTILRNIVESFPELNPEWVLLGRGDMFRNASTPDNGLNNDANGVKPSNSARSASHQGVNSNGNIDVTEIVRATVSQLQRPSRKIKEVHIFFDDGTYEIFGPTRRVE